MNILAIDTSTAWASATLLTSEGKTLTKQSDGQQQYAVALFQWLEEIGEEAGIPYPFEHIEAVVVTSGPGSFTGLRIGIAAAKGLALSRNCPLIGIPTLEAFARAYPGDIPLRQPFIPAGRGELYTALYDFSDLDHALATSPLSIVKPREITLSISERKSVIFGPGLDLIPTDELNNINGDHIIDRECFCLTPAMALHGKKLLASDDFHPSERLQIEYVRKAVS